MKLADSSARAPRPRPSPHRLRTRPPASPSPSVLSSTPPTSLATTREENNWSKTPTMEPSPDRWEHVVIASLAGDEKLTTYSYETLASGLGYRKGVPMGGDLPAAPDGQQAPVFMVGALKDPWSGNRPSTTLVCSRSRRLPGRPTTQSSSASRCRRRYR